MDTQLDGLAAALTPSRPVHVVAPAGLEAWLGGLAPEQAEFLRASGFKARAQQIALLPTADGVSAAVLGLGEQAPDSPWAYGALPLALPEGSCWHLGAGADPQAATLGWLLGAYRFRRFRSGPYHPARLLPPAEAEPAIATARAICRARDLINTPAADCGPAELAAAVLALGATHGATTGIIEGEALAAGFPALRAVGLAAASGREPRVAVLRWGDPAHPLVALCGKGVCFDTGGLDLKPAEGMRRMKKDMGGAAIMIALAESIMTARMPVRLLLLVGAVENSVGPLSFRPGDILRTRKGLTVEVGNTDAEGRLVLADLLTYAAEQAPALILDAATLTGAARVALGPDLPALFSDDESVAAAFCNSGMAAHDAVWRLPIHESYGSWLDSPVADLVNVATRPMAGAVVAALFLRRFVPSDVPWAHLDVYAWNDQSRPGRPEGGECQAMRGLRDGLAALVRQFGATKPRPDALITH
ncbi:leucyl aminopeptidase [Humitalea rosea]|uniref:Leucyl aminopeptidase n=2 Tax=Humitalea rosea TaxID=990373 RepID=A0A2W7IE80_9PROT|nr:leucyl aminopeptidase [Humitalea rosea]